MTSPQERCGLWSSCPPLPPPLSPGTGVVSVVIGNHDFRACTVRQAIGCKRITRVLLYYVCIYIYFCEKEQAAITVGVFLVGSRWLDSIFWFTNMQGFMPSDLSSTMQGVQRSEKKWNEVNRVAQEAALRTLKLRLRHGFSFFHRLLLATLATYMSRFPLPSRDLCTEAYTWGCQRLWPRPGTAEQPCAWGAALQVDFLVWWFVFYENYLAIKTIFHIFHMYRWYFGHLICI